MPTHDIRADLIYNDRGAAQKMGASAASAGKLDHSLRSAQASASGLVERLLAVGGAYLGVSTGISAAKNLFGGLVSSAVKYTSELEASKISLTSIFSAVEAVPWDQAGAMADKAFEVIKQLSIASPATPQEMFDIFKGVLGPVRAAGASIEQVYDLTNDTALAAVALGEDYAQASRDISMMMRGTAGMDVKLFSMLRSTGAIKEDTEQWNKNLTGMQRVEKLSAALKKFSGSGEAFGRSWMGITSTLKGIQDEAKRSFIQPIMTKMASSMVKLGDMLIANQGRILQAFSVAGDRWAHFVGRVFDTVLAKITPESITAAAFKLGEVANFLDRIFTKFQQLDFGKIVGEVKTAAQVSAGLKVGSMVVNGAQAAKGLLGGFGGAEAAGAGEGVAVGAAAGEGAGEAAAVAGAAGLGSSLLALGAVLVGAAALAMAVQRNWESLRSEFQDHFLVLGYELDDLGVELGKTWEEILNPALVALGDAMVFMLKPAVHSLLAVLEAWIAVETSLLGWTRTLVVGIETLSDTIAAWFNKMGAAADNAFNTISNLIDGFGKLAAAMATVFGGPVGQIIGAGLKGGAPAVADWFKSHTLRSANGAGDETPAGEEYGGQNNRDYVMAQYEHSAPLTTPGARKPSNVTNVNASGARVTIKQSFGDQDPDRVVQLMMNDLTTQAESRLTSAFAPAFTR